MARRYSGDRQRLPALLRGWRSVGGLGAVASETIQKFKMIPKDKTKVKTFKILGYVFPEHKTTLRKF